MANTSPNNNKIKKIPKGSEIAGTLQSPDTNMEFGELFMFLISVLMGRKTRQT